MKNQELHIVTGAAGRLGFPFCLELKQRGYYIRALYLEEDENVRELAKMGIEVVQCDVTIPEQVDLALKDGTYVYHLAGVISIESKVNQEVSRVNVSGTVNVIEACLKNGVKRLVHVGSVHMILLESKTDIIHEPKHFYPEKLAGAYSVSKAVAGNLVLDAVKKRGLDAVMGLPSAIIGPYDYGSNFGETVAEVINGRLRISFKGRYNFVDVRDVARALADLALKGVKGEVYNITGHNLTVNEMLNIVAAKAKVKPIKTNIPVFLVKVASRFMEARSLRQGLKPTATPYSIRVLQENSNFSHQKLTNLINYHPRSAVIALQDQVNFYLEHKKRWL